MITDDALMRHAIDRMAHAEVVRRAEQDRIERLDLKDASTRPHGRWVAVVVEPSGYMWMGFRCSSKSRARRIINRHGGVGFVLRYRRNRFRPRKPRESPWEEALNSAQDVWAFPTELFDYMGN